MIIEWEISDIIPGRWVKRKKSEEQILIGYLAFENSEKKYVTISSLDGAISKPADKKDLALRLTNKNYIPVGMQTFEEKEDITFLVNQTCKQ